MWAYSFLMGNKYRIKKTRCNLNWKSITYFRLLLTKKKKEEKTNEKRGRNLQQCGLFGRLNNVEIILIIK